MTYTQALLAIAKRDGGTITPAAVIAEAKNPDSVLHSKFTWDNRKAAEKWRILEAQRLIRTCMVTVGKGEEKVKTFAFIGLSDDRNNPSPNNPYRILEDVSKDEDLVAIAERDCLAQLSGLQKRYDYLKKFTRVWKAIDKAGETGKS